MSITEQLHDLVGDEPPYLLRPEQAIAAGRRGRRLRRLALTGTGAVAVAGVASLAVVLGSAGPPARTSLVGTAPTATAEGDGSAFYRTVRALTPSGWTIANAIGDDSGWQADVDDGAGPGRLSIGLSPHPGSIQQHPCSDREFALTGSCVETQLDADTRLIVRGVQTSGEFRDLDVVIVHTDGGGTMVEADNATWPAIPEGTVITTADQKRALTRGTVHRSRPAYSADQLVAIAKAIDGSRS